MPKLLKILALVAVLLLVAGTFLALRLRSHLTADSLVADLEKNYGVRAQVGGYEASVFSSPSRLEITDLVLAPRDEVAAQGVPHSEREPLPDSASILRADKVELEVDLRDLLGWELDLKKLLVHGLVATITIDEEGESSVAPLIRKPGAAAPAAGEGASEEQAEQKKKKKKERLPIAATMDRVAVASGTITIENLKQGSRTTLNDLRIEITDIDLDASNLSERNHCKLKLDTRLSMTNLNSEIPFLNFFIHAEGEATPLDATKGHIAPALDAEVTLAAGSTVSGIPFLQMLSGSLDALERVGLKLGDLTRGELVEEAKAQVSYGGGVLAFKTPFDLNLDRYTMGLSEGSWLSTKTLEHDFKGGLAISETMTAEARKGVENFLLDKGGKTAAEIGTSAVLDPLLNAAGRINLQFVSSGLLPDPDVGVVTPLADIGDIMEEVGSKLIKKKGGLEGLLKGILD